MSDIDPHTVTGLTDSIKWLFGLILIPLTWFAKLVWDNHKRANKFDLVLGKQENLFKELIRKHQKWVSENHPTIKHFDQRMEDMITPIQLSVLQNHQDMKDQAEKIDAILLHMVEEKGRHKDGQ